jgi:hypothetical protein
VDRRVQGRRHADHGVRRPWHRRRRAPAALLRGRSRGLRAGRGRPLADQPQAAGELLPEGRGAASRVVRRVQGPDADLGAVPAAEEKRARAAVGRRRAVGDEHRHQPRLRQRGEPAVGSAGARRRARRGRPAQAPPVPGDQRVRTPAAAVAQRQCRARRRLLRHAVRAARAAAARDADRADEVPQRGAGGEHDRVDAAGAAVGARRPAVDAGVGARGRSLPGRAHLRPLGAVSADRVVESPRPVHQRGDRRAAPRPSTASTSTSSAGPAPNPGTRAR